VRGRVDLTATAWALELCANELSLDNDEGWHGRDPETFYEVWPIFLGDAVELERLVVLPSLQNLSKEPFRAPAGAGHARVKEDQSGLDAGAHGRGG
jgi:hypothetical protein